MHQLRKLQWWRAHGSWHGLRAIYVYTARRPAQVRRMEVHAHCVNAAEESSSVFAWCGAASYIILSLQREMKESVPFALRPALTFTVSLVFLPLPHSQRRECSRARQIYVSSRCRGVQQLGYPCVLGEIAESIFIRPFGSSVPDRRARERVDYKHGAGTEIKSFSHDGRRGARTDVVGK